MDKELRESIIEFIDKNIEGKNKISFMFDDVKTGKKDIKVYLGDMFTIAKEESIKNYVKGKEGVGK